MPIEISFVEIETELSLPDTEYDEMVTKYDLFNDVIRLNNYDDIKYMSYNELGINVLPTLPKNLITLYCDENETLYKIKIYKSFKNKFNQHTLEIPKIDLTEPLTNLANYILKSLSKNKRTGLNDKFNLSITKLMILLDNK